MDRECLSSVLTEANAVQKNIEAVFKNKDLQTVMREGSTFKRELLAESVFNLKETLSVLIESVEKCGITSTPTCDYVKKDELKDMLVSLIPMISESVKNQLNEPCSHQPVEIEKVTSPASEKRDHVIVVHGEVGNSNFDGFNDSQWNTVVKKKLSSKLKSIPIKNSLKTKDGKACLFVENEATMNEVREALKDDYNVETNKAKSNKIYPKLKMFDLDTSVYNENDTDKLKADILDKSMGIKCVYETSDIDTLFEVIFINTKFNYAILKMSEHMRDAIKKQKNRVYLDLTSHITKDNFHVTQCFKCQKFGHKSGSPHCSGIQVCLYCGGNHKSSECKVKDDTSKHSCSNCKMTSEFAHQAHTHQSNSYQCPVYLKETETVIRKTAGISTDDFLMYRAKLYPRQGT